MSFAVQQGKTFDELSLDEYQRFSPHFDRDVFKITLESSVAAREVVGGTGPRQVAKALRAARKMVGGTIATE